MECFTSIRVFSYTCGATHVTFRYDDLYLSILLAEGAKKQKSKKYVFSHHSS